MTEVRAPLIAGDVLTQPELQHLRRVSGVRGALLVLHAWVVIAGAIALCALWPSVVTFAIGVLVVGARQLGLAILMHDAAHWRLAAHAKLNDVLARWGCAFPIGLEGLKPYRRRHHLHHRYTRQADDPDLALAAPYPVAPGVFWRAIASDLVGVTFCRRVVQELRTGEPGVRARWARWRGPVGANAVVFGALALSGQWPLYFALWLLPLATWYQALTRIRDVAEHALASEDDDPLRNTRTVHAGWLARALVAPYWMNYHLEHHLLVFVPCWKLADAHAVRVAKGYRPQMELADSYATVLRRITAAS